MTAFDASSTVKPLTCTLQPYAKFEGTVPEPSSVQVQVFVNARRAEAERIRGLVADLPEGTTAEQINEILSAGEARAEHRNNAEMLAAVCSGEPSADQLEQLPHRQIRAFGQWLIGELLSLNPGGGSDADPTTSSADGG